MSKNRNRNRIKAAPSYKRELPVLLDLETADGLTMARCFAISTGIQSAVEEKRQKLTLTHAAREAGAIEIALKYEKIKKGGKRGISNPKQFRELFMNLATRMHEAMLRYMEEEPQIFLQLLAMTPEQRNRQALMTAETYCEQICATPDDVPLTLSRLFTLG